MKLTESKIIVICMPNRIDYINKELSKYNLNYTICEAINATNESELSLLKKLSLITNKKWLIGYGHKNYSQSTLNKIACYISHYKALTMLDGSPGIIMEDDIVIAYDISIDLNIDENKDIVYFGGYSQELLPNYVSYGFNDIRPNIIKWIQAYCYYVSKPNFIIDMMAIKSPKSYDMWLVTNIQNLGNSSFIFPNLINYNIDLKSNIVKYKKDFMIKSTNNFNYNWLEKNTC